MMKAIVMTMGQPNERASYQYVEVDDPKAQAGELLIAVKSIGINRIDLLRVTTHGGPSAGRPLIPGLEMAGEVIGMGDGVTEFKIGDRVMGMTIGAYAEKATIDQRFALHIPSNFSFDQAAAVATVFPTAHNALVTNGGFVKGLTVLIQGINSAVGTAALQMAKALGAKKVIGTAISRTFESQLQDMGLDKLILTPEEDVVGLTNEVTEGRGVDLIVDMVGGPVIQQNIDSVALGGRIVNVGWVGGTKGEIDLDVLARKRITLVGVSFRTRTVEQKQALYDTYAKEIFPLYEQEKIRPIIYKTFPLSEASAAQDQMATNRHFGKFLLHP